MSWVKITCEESEQVPPLRHRVRAGYTDVGASIFYRVWEDPNGDPSLKDDMREGHCEHYRWEGDK